MKAFFKLPIQCKDALFSEVISPTTMSKLHLESAPHDSLTTHCIHRAVGLDVFEFTQGSLLKAAAVVLLDAMCVSRQVAPLSLLFLIAVQKMILTYSIKTLAGE